jgi:hypothetical protein
MRSRCLALAGALLAAATAAVGHPLDPGLLELREGAPGVFQVAWRPPAADPEGLVPELPTRCRRLDGPGWRVDCGPGRLRGERIAVHGLAERRVDVIVRVAWQDGDAAHGVLGGAADAFVVPGARTGAALAVLASYGRLGVEHILLGTDHLLFVLGLVLLVRSRRALVTTITAFTVAHSLTLALAALGFVHVPPAPIEALIAASIVFVAVELTRAPDAPPSLAARRPWLLAFGFGLLHGLGFAGALAEVGLPAGQVPLALLGFNAGVEAGQLAFVVAVGIAMTAGARLPLPWLRLRLLPAYAIGGLAVAWTLERLERVLRPLVG